MSGMNLNDPAIKEKILKLPVEKKREVLKLLERRKDIVTKERCEESLLYYAKYIFENVYDQEFIVSDHHIKMCEALDKVERGEITRLILNVPPRYTKTELVVKLFISRSIAKNPKSKSIHLSYSSHLALDNSAQIKEIVLHPAFQKYWPIKLKQDSKSKEKWYTTQGGGMYATSSGGAITGFGAGSTVSDEFSGGIFIDDPIKPDDADSETYRNRINGRYNSTIRSRVNSRETPIVIIMQRLHEEDMTGYLLGGGSNEDWEHIVIPAISTEGKALWPMKHTIEELKAMEKADSYHFAGQYMQAPSPRGGGIFKDKWWKRYSIEPQFDYKIIVGDTAQKAKEENDFSVFQCWGVSDKKFYLIDNLRGKWESPELRRNAINFWNKHDAIGFYIEDKSSGIGLIQDLREESIPAIPIPRTTDKVLRARNVTPIIESGFVYIPEESEWLIDYEKEFSRFPKAKNDDQVDVTVDAIQILSDREGNEMYPLQAEESSFLVNDFKLSPTYTRIYGIELLGGRVFCIWAAYDRYSDVIYLYSEYKGGASEPVLHATAIKTRGEMKGVYCPKAQGRSEIDGKKAIRPLKKEGLKFMTDKAEQEQEINNFYQRLTTGRLKVSVNMQNFMQEYRTFKRDDKGNMTLKDFPMLRAAFNAVYGSPKFGVSKIGAKSQFSSSIVADRSIGY